ncbi:type II secretion system F family protein [Salinisphaera sp. SWV1]|uniref:type II secretion system F family protein n=1 Tax=Salinisphaera sp. SWV1 TaxID=3454139 RepID=UPI003F8270BB
MPAELFHYEATNAQGVGMEGHIEADSESAAYRALQAQGLLPLTIAPARQPRGGRLRSRRLTGAMRKQAVEEMATLLASGVPLSEALPSLRKGHANTPLGTVFDELHAGLRGGDSFSESLERSRLSLPPDVLQMIRAGEAAGDLGGAMRTALDRMEYVASSQRELRNALIYPAILVIAGLAAIVLIFAIVVPRFQRLLSKGGDSVPWISRVVLHIGMFLHDHWLFVLAGVAGVAGVCWALLQQPQVRRTAEDTLLRLPGIGSWLLQAEMGRWTHSLGALLSSKVPLARALALSAEAVTIASLRRRLTTVQANIRAGERLTDALERQHLIDPMGANLLRVGEQSGRLAEVLASLTRVYNTSATQRMKRFLLLLEPAAILFIGASIGLLMVAIMLAVTSLNNAVLQ